MPSVDKLLSNLNKIDLLPVQQKVLNKLMQKPFEIAKKGSYEPLYDLLKTMFVTEYPNFQISKEIAHLYFENDVENKQSAYGNFQSYALMFYSYFSEENIKKEVYHKITQHADPIVLQKRIDRCKEETLLKKTLQTYHQLSSTSKNDEVYQKGFTAIIAALQVLQYLPDDQKQIDSMHQFIEEIVLRLKGILPKIKSI